ncbi:MAG TPA: RodZ domain-containing protein [Candidatus Acidoferrales bacterium]|jgi:cytoskeleton protein RodZ|nr:RodZ domain-containing protein [Candidatus Acidoferrales bacterium]
MPALGDRFRSAREARGLSLSDVSEQIRIRSIYLAAIEDENWSAVGAPVYIRGFLRTYARFLGLDPEDVVAAFNGEVPSAAATTASAGNEPSRPVDGGRARPSGAYLIWVAGAIAVLLVAFVVYNEVTMHRSATVVVETAAPTATPSELPSNAPSPAALAVAAYPPPCPSASPVPSVSPRGSAAPSPSASPSPCPSPSITPEQIAALGAQSMAIVLIAPSWLRVTVDGSVSMEGTFPAGTSRAFHGKAAAVRVGNAGGVTIYVDGKDVGKLGKSGDVIDRSFTL